jgi:Fe-S cluster assembly ATPase SufC
VSIKSDSGHIADNFCEEWVTGLDWEDRASLGLFLSFQLKSVWERERQKQKS